MERSGDPAVRRVVRCARVRCSRRHCWRGRQPNSGYDRRGVGAASLLAAQHPPFRSPEHGCRLTPVPHACRAASSQFSSFAPSRPRESHPSFVPLGIGNAAQGSGHSAGLAGRRTRPAPHCSCLPTGVFALWWRPQLVASRQVTLFAARSPGHDAARPSRFSCRRVSPAGRDAAGTVEGGEGWGPRSCRHGSARCRQFADLFLHRLSARAASAGVGWRRRGGSARLGVLSRRFVCWRGRALRSSPREAVRFQLQEAEG